jgi:hypothetical protein
VLLTRSPLYSPEGFHARLACLIHTANVRSEPGSNPSESLFLGFSWSLRRPRTEARDAHARMDSRATLVLKELCAEAHIPPPMEPFRFREAPGAGGG